MPFRHALSFVISLVVVGNASQVQGLAVPPQALQPVKFPGLVVENVDGDAAVIQQHPRAAAVALAVQRILPPNEQMSLLAVSASLRSARNSSSITCRRFNGSSIKAFVSRSSSKSYGVCILVLLGHNSHCVRSISSDSGISS